MTQFLKIVTGCKVKLIFLSHTYFRSRQELQENQTHITTPHAYFIFIDQLTFLKHWRRKSVIDGDRLSGIGGCSSCKEEFKKNLKKMKCQNKISI